MNTSGAKIYIKNAELSDLPGILHVEQSWDEAGRASKEKFEARINKFAQGFFLAQVNEGDGLKTVATITSMPILYSAAHLHAYTRWDAVTNNGYFIGNISNEHPTKNGENGLYIASGVIDQAYRGSDVFSPMVKRVAAQAEKIGMRYVLAGAVLPGYKKYCEKHGDLPAHEYCKLRKGHSLVDPLLAMYEKIGFHVPDERHVLPEYFPDDASRSYAALVVCDLSKR